MVVEVTMDGKKWGTDSSPTTIPQDVRAAKPAAIRPAVPPTVYVVPAGQHNAGALAASAAPAAAVPPTVYLVKVPKIALFLAPRRFACPEDSTK